MNNFQLYSQYYDLLYKDKNYVAEAEYVAKTLKKYHKNVATIIELGSGTGSHAEHLCTQGFKIFGVERSGEMVELAKQKNIVNYFPVVGDITTFKLNKKADAAISLFHVISYLTTNEQLIACFNQTWEHLNTNGIFLFDVWYTPAVYTQKPETRIKRLSNETIEVTRLAEPQIHYNDNAVDVNYEVIIKDKISGKLITLLEKHPMRHFSIPEIELMAKLTGFELIKVEEFLTINPTSEKTWGVCFILRKK